MRSLLVLKSPADVLRKPEYRYTKALHSVAHSIGETKLKIIYDMQAKLANVKNFK